MSHGKLPWIAFTPLTAHGDDGKERHAACGGKRQGVDRIANTAALHEQRAAATASFAAGDAVEACFGSGSVWYPATVLSTLDREGMPMVMVRYDEDDEEEELEPCFVRKTTLV